MMNKEWIQANKEKSQIFGVIGGCFIIISITLIAMSAILKQTKLLFILFIILGTQLVCIRKRNHFIISSTIYLFTINTSILYFACIFGKESNLQILYYALFTIGFSFTSVWPRQNDDVRIRSFFNPFWALFIFAAICNGLEPKTNNNKLC